MKLDIFVVGFLGHQALADTLASVARWSAPGYRLTVYENTVKNYPLTWLWNRFICQSRRAFVALLNPDVIVGPGWDTEVIACLDEHPSCGAASPVTNHEAHREHFKGSVPTMEDVGRMDALTDRLKTLHPTRRFLLGKDRRFAPGHCTVIRRSSWKAIKGFDENIAFAGNDYDFNLRLIEAGMDIGIAAHAACFHKWGVSTAEAKVAGIYDDARQRPKFNLPAPGEDLE